MGDFPRLGMVEFDRHVAVSDLRVLEDFGHVVHLADADVGLGEEREPFVASLGTQDFLQFVTHSVVAFGRRLREVRGLHAAVLPVRPVQGVADVVPQPGLGAADRQQLAVLGGVHAVVGIPPAEHTLRTGRQRAVSEIVAHVRGGGQERDGRVQVGDVHELALAGLPAREKGEHDAERAVHRGAGVIGHDVEGNRRRAFGRADQVQHAAQRQIVEVVGRVVTVRPVLAEPAQGAVHEARIERLQRVVVAAQPLHHAGPKALDQHVVFFGQSVQHGLAVGVLQVQGQAFLVAVRKAGGDGARLVRPGGGAGAGQFAGRRRFDLEHLGPHVRQHHGAERAGPDAGEFQNFYAFESESHGASLRGVRGRASINGSVACVPEEGGIVDFRLWIVDWGRWALRCRRRRGVRVSPPVRRSGSVRLRGCASETSE